MRRGNSWGGSKTVSPLPHLPSLLRTPEEHPFHCCSILLPLLRRFYSRNEIGRLYTRVDKVGSRDLGAMLTSSYREYWRLLIQPFPFTGGLGTPVCSGHFTNNIPLALPENIPWAVILWAIRWGLGQALVIEVFTTEEERLISKQAVV